MRVSTVLLAATIPACGFGGGSSSDDAPIIDAMPPPPDAQTCFVLAGAPAQYCFASAADLPTAPPAFGDAPTIEIETGSSALCNPHVVGADKLCFVTGTTITLAAGQTIRAYGAKPLVLAAFGAVELHGTIDVSSTGVTTDSLTSTKRGAGARLAAGCGGVTNATGISGGFGGGLGGKGGDGEKVDPGVAGIAANVAGFFEEQVFGGCPGGDGAMGADSVGGRGGLGGGAVAVVGLTIHLDGTINASGAGGGNGINNPGGAGGGGSGGMIILQTETLKVDGAGKLFANGGGGGEGGANGSGNAGQPGGVSTAPNVAALGGTSGKDGGNGGNGSVGATLGGANAAGQRNPGGGGGGAGGGAGLIHAAGVNGDAVISPPSLDFPTPI